jgi:hypothetical protein
MGTDIGQGYFSLLRYRADITRDEAKNVAVLFVDTTSGTVTLRATRVNSVSSTLAEQGFLDGIVEQLAARFADQRHADVDVLQNLHESLERSIVVTEPRPVAIPEGTDVLTTLYRAFVAPKPSPRNNLSKSALLGVLVDWLRSTSGGSVERFGEIDTFTFDAVVRNGGLPQVYQALSFAGTRKDWSPVLHDAGHFIFALERVKTSAATAILQEPTGDRGETGEKAYERVEKWLDDARVKVVPAQDVLSKGQRELY